MQNDKPTKLSTLIRDVAVVSCEEAGAAIGCCRCHDALGSRCAERARKAVVVVVAICENAAYDAMRHGTYNTKVLAAIRECANAE